MEWHRRGLVPLGRALMDDRRCEVLEADFFARVKAASLHPGAPDRRFHAILVDIDHSARHVLHPSHAEFYEAPGLARLAAHLLPGGAFAPWSNDPPDDRFCDQMAQVFARWEAQVVTFDNPLTGGTASNTVYVARRGELP